MQTLCRVRWRSSGSSTSGRSCLRWPSSPAPRSRWAGQPPWSQWLPNATGGRGNGAGAGSGSGQMWAVGSSGRGNGG
jgi:hypothetical protein